MPARFTSFRFSQTAVPGADDAVGYTLTTFTLPRIAGLPQTPPVIGTCDIARADAVVVRVCAMTSDGLDPLHPRGGELSAVNRATLEPLLQQARALQTA